MRTKGAKGVKPAKEKRIQVRSDEELMKKITILAERRNVKESVLVRTLIEEAFAQL